MLPYVAPSRKLGYTMLAVSPQDGANNHRHSESCCLMLCAMVQEISAQWKELDWLVSRSCSQAHA
eukprot:3562438-Amphidinium_carterae.2